MAPAACEPAADDRFGPIVGPECRNGLDFTLRFEDTILSILPAAIFSALALHAILRRHRTRSLVDGKALLCAKLPACTQLAYLVLLALRIALIAEWALSPVRHVTAIAAAVVAAVEVIPMAVLSYYDHARSLRPSTLLGCYLLTTLMFDIARVRTLWLMRASSAVTSTFTAAFSLKALALILETIEKRRSIVAIQSKDAAPEETSGPISRAVFWWVNPLLVVGCRRDLSVVQLPSIGLDMDSETIHHSFESAWAQRRQYSLLITLLRAFKLEILYAVVPRLCLLGFTLAQPFFIERLILFVEEPRDDKTYFVGPMLIVACALIYVGAAVATAVYWHMTYRWVTMVRGSLVTAIYRKALNTPSGSVTESAALTLMGTDVEKVIIGLEDTHEVWASILQVAVAVWLLERQVSWACVVPVLLCLACVLSPLCLAARIGQLQKSWNEAVQKRLHVTADTLGRIKEARLMGLSGILSSMIQNLRVEELRRSRALRKLLVVVLTICMFSFTSGVLHN
ncbi:ABC transporter C family member 4 [Lasiodiplodia theobromae]|uniref:ABC transporter C family member 4 n=1 Tax=Lasiodiplodia theobromae TaxID=45133 RepID=A0A5N5D092_9PEZI|nr:ABC transporter C family member 4 [Lasiodiplodia theobromae]